MINIIQAYLIIVLLSVLTSEITANFHLLSQEKNVYASSIEQTSLLAENAVDGDPFTHWVSAEIILHWGAVYGKSYEIQISNDANSTTIKMDTTKDVIAVFEQTDSNAKTPIEINGQLSVDGVHLVNQYGNPIQLRGMSTHGLQWFWNNYTDESLDVLAYEWGADILRISMYVQEGGWETNPDEFTAKVNTLIEKTTDRGMYALVDWHQLDPPDPNYNLDNAKIFFTEIATKHKDKNNIIYDICNEPSDVPWNTIKSYADSLIPIIRNIDDDCVIIMGTHGWASLGVSDGKSHKDILNNPVDFPNVMYGFHFYAASHRENYLNELKKASKVLPIFVTEFGTQKYDGDQENDFDFSQKYIDLMAERKISWANWNYSDDFRSGAVWKSSTTGINNGPWTDDNLKPSGIWIKDKILNPNDDFPINPTSVSDDLNEQNSELPFKFELYQNYPNPFNPITNISFNLVKSGVVSLMIYNSIGQEIKDVINNEILNAGLHNYAVNMNKFSSGVYFYILKQGSNVQIQKMVLIK